MFSWALLETSCFLCCYKCQNLGFYSKIWSTKEAVIQSMDGLKTVILDAGSDREIGYPPASLDISYLQSCGWKDSGMCCSMIPSLHPEGYTAMLVYPCTVWAFLTVLVLPLGLIIILKKKKVGINALWQSKISIKCQLKDSSVQAWNWVVKRWNAESFTFWIYFVF